MSLARAIETGDLAELPSRRDEDWRWTDLRALIREMPAPSQTYAGELAPGVFDHLADQSVTIVNGERRTRLSVATAEPRVLALRIIARDATAHAAQPEITIGGHLVLLETYEGAGGDYLSEIDLKINVAAGGRLERIVLAEDTEDAVSVSRADISLGAGASFTQTVITCGAKRQRIETHVRNPGRGTSVRLDGLYLLQDRRHADITTVVTHAGVEGTTDQLVKGVVRDQARGVFQGRIVVAHGADKTDARMGHHALVLSDRAEVDAKPELEIYADDVACAHGNTVGALDEDALFYAQQRGIPLDEARAMLTEAFVVEVVDRIAHDGAREVVRAWVADRLRAAS
jgi:Fe-S cluster assembly protein SufD